MKLPFEPRSSRSITSEEALPKPRRLLQVGSADIEIRVSEHQSGRNVREQDLTASAIAVRVIIDVPRYRVMRLEAERRASPKPPQPAGKADPSQYPPLHSDTDAESDAAIDWLAHIAAGRIPCPEPVDGEVK